MAAGWVVKQVSLSTSTPQKVGGKSFQVARNVTLGVYRSTLTQQMAETASLAGAPSGAPAGKPPNPHIYIYIYIYTYMYIYMYTYISIYR